MSEANDDASSLSNNATTQVTVTTSDNDSASNQPLVLPNFTYTIPMEELINSGILQVSTETLLC